VAPRGDAATYGKFNDAGYSKTSQWAGQANLPAGYWVYVAPNWYIWESQALTPKVSAATAHTNAAAEMQGRMVTIYLDNGTPVAGRLVERTDDYYVLLLPAGPKKLIFKAKITSIEWSLEPADNGHPASVPAVSR
jgi:sRNA-binding regulator protein Hfq